MKQKIVTAKKSNFDLSVEKQLTSMLGEKLLKKKVSKYPRGSKLAGPWRHDFKNNCVKCNKAYHLQEHHITYEPALKVFLCEKCHNKITALNTAAAIVARTNLKTKLTYTNKIRVIIWRWFLKNKLTDKKHLNIIIKDVLTKTKPILQLEIEAVIKFAQSLCGYIDKWIHQNNSKTRSLKVNRALLESNSTKHTLIPSLHNTTADEHRGCFG